jgi:hypothetical protein
LGIPNPYSSMEWKQKTNQKLQLFTFIWALFFFIFSILERKSKEGLMRNKKSSIRLVIINNNRKIKIGILSFPYMKELAEKKSENARMLFFDFRIICTFWCFLDLIWKRNQLAWWDEWKGLISYWFSSCSFVWVQFSISSEKKQNLVLSSEIGSRTRYHTSKTGTNIHGKCNALKIPQGKNLYFKSLEIRFQIF